MSEPEEKLSASPPSSIRSRQAQVMTTMPAHVRGATLSRKNANAITDVATISKLLSSVTFSGVACARPAMSSSGAATSRATIATTYGASARPSGASPATPDPARASTRERTTTSTAIPRPAPRYSSAAIMFEGTLARRTLENGVLSAYRHAASSADATNLPELSRTSGTVAPALLASGLRP